MPTPLARYKVPAAASRARVTATAAPCARVRVSGVALPVRLPALAGALVPPRPQPCREHCVHAGPPLETLP